MAASTSPHVSCSSDGINLTPSTTITSHSFALIPFPVRCNTNPMTTDTTTVATLHDYAATRSDGHSRGAGVEKPRRGSLYLGSGRSVFVQRKNRVPLGSPQISLPAKLLTNRREANNEQRNNPTSRAARRAPVDLTERERASKIVGKAGADVELALATFLGFAGDLGLTPVERAYRWSVAKTV